HLAPDRRRAGRADWGTEDVPALYDVLGDLAWCEQQRAQRERTVVDLSTRVREVERVEAQLGALERSMSWHLTRPLRALRWHTTRCKSWCSDGDPPIPP